MRPYRYFVVVHHVGLIVKLSSNQIRIVFRCKAVILLSCMDNISRLGALICLSDFGLH